MKLLVRSIKPHNRVKKLLVKTNSREHQKEIFSRSPTFCVNPLQGGSDENLGFKHRDETLKKLKRNNKRRLTNNIS